MDGAGKLKISDETLSSLKSRYIQLISEQYNYFSKFEGINQSTELFYQQEKENFIERCKMLEEIIGPWTLTEEQTIAELNCTIKDAMMYLEFHKKQRDFQL